MPQLRWLLLDPSEGAPELREAVLRWGYELSGDDPEVTALIVAKRPDPQRIPVPCAEVLWWVEDATPEEASAVLVKHPGYVLRQSRPLHEVRDVLELLQHRDLGSEGWLRQMLHLATLDELLRVVLTRALALAKARNGAIWIRQEDRFFQRVGEGFAEAPIPVEEAESLVSHGEAWFLVPSERMGLLRMKDCHEEASHSLGWIAEIQDMLINAWNLEKSQALHLKDDLTVAQNRRCLEAELPKVVREAASRGESVALLFMDVDNLKALNSRFGHPIGSKVLTTVAIEAQRNARAQDRLYRYGGDEFCILMPGTSEFGATKLGERLIHGLMSNPMSIGDQSIPISISIGIATFPAHADGAEKLLERADRALFQAKAEGKGRVVVAC